MKGANICTWMKDKKNLGIGMLVGALVVGLLWFVSANTEASIFKALGNPKAIQPTAPSVIETGN